MILKMKQIRILGIVAACLILIAFMQKKINYSETLKNDLVYVSDGYALYVLEEIEDLLDKNKLLKYFCNGNSDEMRQIINNELNNTNWNDKPDYTLKLLVNLVALEIRDGNVNLADNIFENACQLIEDHPELSKSESEIKLYNNYSFKTYRSNDKEVSFGCINYAAESLSYSENTMLSLIINTNLICFSFDLYDQSYIELEEYLKKLDTIIDSEKKIMDSDYLLTIHCYLVQGNINLEIGDYKQAQKTFKKIKAYENKENIIYKPVIIHMKIIEGYMYAEKKDYKIAEQIYQSLLDDAEKSLGKDHILLASLQRRYGALCMTMGDKEKGIQYSLLALDGYTGARRRRTIWANIGKAYNSMGEYQEAEKYLFLAYHAAIEYASDEAADYLTVLQRLHGNTAYDTDFNTWLEQKMEDTLALYEIENNEDSLLPEQNSTEAA